MNTEELLNARGKTHGEFKNHAAASQGLKRELNRHRKASLNDIQEEALAMILHKIARIISGNPNFKDHWDDIAGYAKLVADRVDNQQ